MEVKLRNMGTVNRNRVTLRHFGREVTLYFSYDTIVAVDEVVSENTWSNTTGKLLNELQPDKKKRVPYETVEKEIEKRLRRLFNSH